MQPVIHECRGSYSILEEETGTFLPGWLPLDTPGTPNHTWREYQYQNGADLDSWPFWAVHALYNGGGYVLDLSGSKYDLQQNLARLKASRWIDEYTRAVFIEFTVYNAQVCRCPCANLHQGQPTEVEPSVIMSYASAND